MKKTKSELYCEMWLSGMTVRQICEATDSIDRNVRRAISRCLNTSTARVNTPTEPIRKNRGRYQY